MLYSEPHLALLIFLGRGAQWATVPALAPSRHLLAVTLMTLCHCDWPSHVGTCVYILFPMPMCSGCQPTQAAYTHVEHDSPVKGQQQFSLLRTYPDDQLVSFQKHEPTILIKLIVSKRWNKVKSKQFVKLKLRVENIFHMIPILKSHRHITTQIIYAQIRNFRGE